MRTTITALAIVLMASGCGAAAARYPGRAPAILGLRGDAGLLARKLNLGYAAGASVGFEASGCCSIAAYGAYTKLTTEARLRAGEPGNEKYVDRILEGGVEVGAVAPWLQDHLRLRLRAGMAGTPPTTTTLGRRGFAGSLAVLYRLSSAMPPEVGEAAPELDAFLGGVVWMLESERDSAGEDDTAPSGGALMLGIRIGAGYGIDLQ